jgi:quercetin dioxygenase-like cupin family protein
MYALSLKLLSLLILIPVVAQAPVPVGEEPRHHVKFQNKYVRVIDAAVPVGDATLFHTHALDNIPVAISGGRLKTEVMGGGEARESTVATGTVTWAPGSYSHRISNIGETPLRFIDAEILASPGSVPNAPALDKTPGHTLVLENERVRIYRVVLDPGQSTGVHTHVLPGLTVAVSRGQLWRDVAGRKSQTMLVNAGEFQWHGGPRRYSIRNIGTERFESVDIEWK